MAILLRANLFYSRHRCIIPIIKKANGVGSRHKTFKGPASYRCGIILSFGGKAIQKTSQNKYLQYYLIRLVKVTIPFDYTLTSVSDIAEMESCANCWRKFEPCTRSSFVMPFFEKCPWTLGRFEIWEFSMKTFLKQFCFVSPCWRKK